MVTTDAKANIAVSPDLVRTTRRYQRLRSPLHLPPSDRPNDHRQAMRELVEGVSAYAKAMNPSFLIIPQNGQELMTDDGTPTGAPIAPYIDAIEGIGREDLF